MLGTPSFMSPEQLQGRTLTGQSDLFSLGVTLYQLLTARLPFRADSMPALMMKIALEPHPRMRAMRPDLPEGIDELMDRALAKDLPDTVLRRRSFASALRALMRAAGRRAVHLKGKLRCVGMTDTGRVREHNEERSAPMPTSASSCSPMAWVATRPAKSRAASPCAR